MRKALLVVMWVSVVVTACKKDGGDGTDGSDPVALSITASDVRPQQILSVAISGTELYENTYQGTLGEEQLELFPANEFTSNTLVCVVPANVGTGVQSLVVNVEGQSLSTTVNVLPNEVITTPEDVFDQFYADYTTPEYTDFIDEAEFQEALDELRALPESDRLIAAQMLANNRVVLDNIAQTIADAEAQTGLGFGRGLNANCDILCAIGAATAVVGAFLSAPIASAVGIGVLAGYVARALKPVVSALWNKLVTGLTAALRLGYDRMAYVTELVYDEADQMISNKVEEVPDTIYLENGSPLKFAIQTVREPIIAEENRSEYPVVGAFLDAYYQLVNLLSGTEYQVPQLQTGEVQDYALDLDDFSISVDNPLVTVSEISGTPELAQVSFDSPQQGAHIFNFTYSYRNDEGLETSFTQTARLLNINTFGSWTGVNTSFSAQNDDYLLNGAIDEDGFYGTRVRLWMGASAGSTSPDCTGVVIMDELFLMLVGYDGPGTYNAYTTGSGRGISSVDVDENLEYDYDLDEFGGDENCTYYSGNPGEGISGTVTITDQEWIGPYLVVDGSLNVTLTQDASVYSHGEANCGLPASFTGDFRLAVQ